MPTGVAAVVAGKEGARFRDGDGRSDVAVVQEDGIGWGEMPWREDSRVIGNTFTDGRALMFG